MKFRPLLLALFVAASFTYGLVACGGSGGGDDDGQQQIDAPGAAIDAPAANIDAPAAMGIGQACTGMGQGDCPTGYTCLSLTGGSGSWCSKTCTAGAGDTCMTGYTGPGKAQCILQVTPQGGGTAMTYCGVICMDQPGDANDYCPGCNGTCPGALVCDAPLMGGMPAMTLAIGCR
jgi:hypothetical protein